MTTSENTLTLNDVKKSPKLKAKSIRVSDLMPDEAKRAIRLHRAKGTKRRRPYNGIDAYCAEILARFGWEAYQAWQIGTISEDRMAKFIAAERAREKRHQLALASILTMAVAGANNGDKHGHAPKSLKRAVEIINKQGKEVNG